MSNFVTFSQYFNFKIPGSGTIITAYKLLRSKFHFLILCDTTDFGDISSVLHLGRKKKICSKTLKYVLVFRSKTPLVHLAKKGFKNWVTRLETSSTTNFKTSLNFFLSWKWPNLAPCGFFSMCSRTWTPKFFE